MTVAETLNKAADLLEPEGAWCQGELAKDAAGFVTRARAKDACAWCAEGAIMRVTDEPFPDDIYSFVTAALRWDRALNEWNDMPERTHGEVIAAMRDAARIAERENL